MTLDDGRAGNSAAIIIRRRPSAPYAQEAHGREDNRRISNSDQAHLFAGLAMRKPSPRILRAIGSDPCQPN